MNWYQMIKESAPPLPSEMDIPEFKPRQYGSNGVRKIRDKLTEEEALQESQSHPILPYIGSGFYGIAYGLDEDIVVKYTDDFREYISAKTILEMQEEKGSLPGIVTIFYVEQMPKSDIYKIYLERVDPLSEQEKRLIAGFYNAYQEGIDFIEYTFSDFYEEYEEFGSSNMNQEIFDKYVILVKKLTSIGASLSDLHEDNIGIDKNGEYVILDVGGLFA